MILYHVTDRTNLDSILKNGLVPHKDDIHTKKCVYLWGDPYLAGDMMGGIKHPDPVMLKVNVPKSWLVVDEGYKDEPYCYGYAFKCFRKISKDRIRIVDAYREKNAKI